MRGRVWRSAKPLKYLLFKIADSHDVNCAVRINDSFLLISVYKVLLDKSFTPTIAYASVDKAK